MADHNKSLHVVICVDMMLLLINIALCFFKHFPKLAHGMTEWVKVVILFKLQRKWRTSLMWLNVPWFLEFVLLFPSVLRFLDLLLKTGTRDQLLKEENGPNTHSHIHKLCLHEDVQLVCATVHDENTPHDKMIAVLEEYSRTSKYFQTSQRYLSILHICTFMHLKLITKKNL